MAEDQIADGGVTDAPVDAPAPTDAPLATEAPASDVPAESDGPSFDWADMRAQLTGGDEALEKVIGRYRSADAFSKAFMAQRQKLSERAEQSVPTLADDATPEQIQQYRELMGIPNDAADYQVGFAEGFELGEADAAALDAFKEHMHGRNIPPSAAQAAIEWYQDTMEADRQQKNANAADFHNEASDTMQVEWGREFEANQNAIKSYINDTLGSEQAEALRGLRLENGAMLMDSPDVLRLLVQPATDYMGGDMMIAGDPGTMAKTVDERMKEILQMRVSDPHGYKEESIQEELAGLYQKKARLEKR